MLTKTINFAVIGCGALAQGQHIATIAAHPRLTLHTCCDLSDKALEVCKTKFGALNITKDYKAAIAHPDVDAIVLATTENFRLPVIEAAAAAGKPIYIEKPMAPTLEEAYAIKKAVDRVKLPVCVGHNRRCSPAMIEARRIFREHMTKPNPCGWRWNREPNRPPLPDDVAASMSVRINDDWYSWKGWVFDKNVQIYGPMLFEMTHFTDLCNWFIDDEPVEVVAMETGLLNHAAIIRYKNSQMATISIGSNGTFGYPKELYEVMGNGGIMVVDHMVEIRTSGIEGAPVRKTYPMVRDRHPNINAGGGINDWLAKKQAACKEAAATGDPLLQFTAEPDKGHAQALELFIKEFADGGPVVCGVDDALMATRVAFAAIKSAHERRVVSLSEI